MRVVMETGEKPEQFFIDHGVPHDRIGERVELGLGRERTVDEQRGDFKKARLLRQLLHGITAVQEHARVAVDISDFAFRAGRGHETRVEGEDVLFLGQIRDVEHIGSDRPGHGIEYTRLSGGEILEFVFRAHSLYPTAMFRLFQAAALHGRTSESSAYVAEASNEREFASEFAFASLSRYAA